MDYSEKLVVNGLRKGDTKAFKSLYDTHYQVLCHFASRYLRDDYLAESVVGDVMFHLWENHERIEVEVSLRSYLIRCVRNSCLDHLRKNREKYEIATEAIPPSSDKTMVTGNGEQPLGQLLDKELAEKLEVSRQSVSKWEGAQSVPDMDKVVMMSRLFGVSTDFLLKDELEEKSMRWLELSEFA